MCACFALASAIKVEPMALPIPRDPECSMIQTRCSVSRQVSMKWLPVPSVPRWLKLFVLESFGRFSTMRPKRSSMVRQFSKRVGPLFLFALEQRF